MFSDASADAGFLSEGIMPSVTGTSQSTIISNTISGDYRIDVLLEDSAYRWNRAGAPGTPVEVTYSFMSAAPVYTAYGNKIGFLSFTSEQKSAVRQIFADIQAQFNISFKEVADSAYSYGSIRLGNNSQGSTSDGYAYFPDPVIGMDAGDIYINRDNASNLGNVKPGTYAYATLVHEIGHALGLKHPGNYNAGSAPTSEPGNFLGQSEDSESNTVMSYNGVSQGQNRTFYGTYDILSLQYLYGAQAYNAGDNTYAFVNASGQRLEVINDSGGNDTIDVSAVTAGSKINLKDGALSSIGKLANGFTPAIGNVSIAFGVTIENVIGSAYADQITGNDASNRFTPGMGNDTVDGGLGFDIVAYSGTRAQSVISRMGDTILVSDKTGAEGRDTLVNIERIYFRDQAVAFDTEGIAGQAYRLYKAAFNRKPDESGLGYWIDYLEHGAMLADAAAGFTNSPEFKALYGVTPSHSELITHLYNNALHREPEQAGFDWWMNEMASGRATVISALVGFSESPENQANLIGITSQGMEYLPVIR
jgi:hypothetical protein